MEAKGFMEHFTDSQLDDQYTEVYESIPYGGHFGWDWPTLWAVLPEEAAKLSAIRAEMRRRKRVAFELCLPTFFFSRN